ncbi:MAG TPA: DegT/DnrJ/EryC1/StrS family aminotransferase [Thermoanaerobaculia bacterium]|jgi:dTDP-4-amino-4,6-dideoxygalactose transaminase
MSDFYARLSDPGGLIPAGTPLRYPGEAALGGWLTEAELDAATDAIRSSMDWRSGFSSHEEVGAFESELAAYCGVRNVVAVNAAGTALDLVLKTLELKPDDEVIAPSINFHGTHLAILNTGARLVFCESEPHTLNADPDDVARRITKRTRAVLVTHMNGIPADVERITAAGAGRPVIYDAARALGAKYRGRIIGGEGWATIFSLQSKKQMTALGEGGAIATNDDDLARRLRRMRTFGEGSEWGSNFRLTKPQAAVARVQLRRLEEMVAVRRRAAVLREDVLRRAAGVLLPAAQEGDRNSVYVHALLLPSGWTREDRDRLIARLAIEHGIGCVVANPPTYQSSRYIATRVTQRTPLSEEIASRLICPSFHPLMTDEEHWEICEAVVKAIASR